MTRARVVEIHREIAKLHEELAEVMASESEAPTAEESKPRRRTRVHPGPLNAPNDIDVARARKMLRRRGIHT